MKECLDCGILPIIQTRELGVNPEYRPVCPDCNFTSRWSYYEIHAMKKWDLDNYEEPFSEFWIKEEDE